MVSVCWAVSVFNASVMYPLEVFVSISKTSNLMPLFFLNYIRYCQLYTINNNNVNGKIAICIIATSAKHTEYYLEVCLNKISSDE